MPKDIPDRVAYTMALFLTIMGANGLLTYALTGEQPEGMDWWAFRDGGTDEYGKPTRWLFPTYLKDIFAYWQNPVEVLFNKAHPLIGLIKDIAKNKDYYGSEIFNADDNFFLRQFDKGVYALKQFIPFWIRGAVKASESEGGFLKTLEKSPGKLLAPEIGVMPATKAYTMTPFEKASYESMKNRMPVGSRTKEQTEKNKLKRELEGDLRRGDEEAKKNIVDALKEGQINQRDARIIIREAKENPTIRAARSMPLADLVRAVDVANDDEKRLILPVFAKKLMNKAPELDRETRQKYADIFKALRKDVVKQREENKK
jgi:hypothetical protein